MTKRKSSGGGVPQAPTDGNNHRTRDKQVTDGDLESFYLLYTPPQKIEIFYKFQSRTSVRTLSNLKTDKMYDVETHRDSRNPGQDEN